MPQWGLTREMAKSEPWDLPEWCFDSGKVITDPIHGDIYLNRLEQLITDSPPFQRLRRMYQLGTTHLVYPGATHTRFAHSLGALRVAQDLFDVVLNQRNARKPQIEDWFAQLDAEKRSKLEGTTSPAKRQAIERKYTRKVAEAMVLARLGALLHDIGHVPLGHTVEDELGLLTPHDKNEKRLTTLWKAMSAFFAGQARRDDLLSEEELLGLEPLTTGGLREQLKPLITSKIKDPKNRSEYLDPTKLLDYPFVADIVGNTICADLLDYLVRDHRYTGLPISLGQRYMAEFYVTPKVASRVFCERMAIKIHRNNHPRPDVVTELLKHLRYRYELQERVLSHHAKVAADAMVGKMLYLWGKDRLRFKSQAKVRSEMESMFRAAGDDGLLGDLASYEGRTREAMAVRRLARDLQDRRLYRHAAEAVGATAREAIHERFHNPEVQASIARKAEEWAELPSGRAGQVLIWVPPPSMRLKLAEMLVDHGKGISRFVDYSPKGREIYDDHERLWNVRVFVHRQLTPTQEEQVLALLADEMGLVWDRPTALAGYKPRLWPTALAALEACDVPTLTKEVVELLKEPEVLSWHRKGRETHKTRVSALKEARAARSRRA